MTRPRVPLGLEASRTTLDRAVCAELGHAMREARISGGLSVPEVAKNLMLSPAQVAALEEVRPDAFYGAEFYVTALKKYLKYLNLPAADASRALVRPAESSKKPAPFLRSAPAQVPTPKTTRAPALTPTFVAAAVAASAVAGWWTVGPRRQGPPATSSSGRPGAVKPTPEPAQSPPAAEPLVTDPEAPDVLAPEPGPSDLNAATAAVSAVTAVSASLSPAVQASELPAPDQAVTESRHGSISVATSTWVFVRYADNGTDERRLASGGRFVFRGQPVYIAIGIADGTTLVVNGRPIDLAPFRTNGQIRIGKAFLGTLIAGR